LGFEDDMREECTKETRDQGMFCLIPDLNECETFTMSDEICFNEAKQTCIKISFIFLSVLIANVIQIIFETAMLYSLEVTFKPTNLDKL
jgi:hypothetical protein